MLTMVTVQNASGDTLSLPLADSSGGYSVRDIQGLNPVKATLSSSTLAQVDGADPQNARREPRNITMKIGLEPDYAATSVAGLRSNLYGYLIPTSVITLSLWADDILWGTTVATVESFENNMFSSDPEIDISLICYDPAFYAPAETLINASTVSNTDQVTIPYQGSIDAGMIFTLLFDRSVTELRLYNTRPDNKIQLFSVSGSFLSGDKLVMQSMDRQKKLTLTRAGLTSSVLFFLDTTSDWPTLMRGDNLFRAYATGAAIAYTIEYTAKYGGF